MPAHSRLPLFCRGGATLDQDQCPSSTESIPSSHASLGPAMRSCPQLPQTISILWSGRGLGYSDLAVFGEPKKQKEQSHVSFQRILARI